MVQQESPQTLERCTMCGSANLNEFVCGAVGGHYPIKWCEDCGSLHKRSPGDPKWQTMGSEWFAKRHEDGCTCHTIMHKDETRHFKGCPLRKSESVIFIGYDCPEHGEKIDACCEGARRVNVTVEELRKRYTEQHQALEFASDKHLRDITKAGDDWHELKSKHELLREMAHMYLSMSLADPKTFRWSLQGFGMFRLYISKRVRLHVWDPRFAVPNVTTIHSHPWHFKSTVISGKMTDRLYEVNDFGFQSATHKKQSIVCGPDGGPCGDPMLVTVSLLQEVTIEAGKSYSLTADAFHESIPEPGTITIIEREFLEDTEHAYVCFPRNEKWVSAKPRTALPNEVKEMAKFALHKLDEVLDPDPLAGFVPNPHGMSKGGSR